jgi:DNA primase
MMDPDKLLQILEDQFSDYEVRRGEFKINCFACDDYTKNLEISLEKGIFHCWKCNYSGNIYKLFRDLGGGIPEMEEYVSAEDLRNLPMDFGREVKKERKFSGLPKEFRPLWGEEKLSMVGQKALQYVKTRVSEEDIERYKIGYCGLGRYKWRIIVPVFEDSEIVYFIARSMYKNLFPSYQNPGVEECGVGKDSVVFNIDRARELGRAVICEGVFDAIRVGEDGVALFGSSISDDQFFKLLEIPKLCILLDQDATYKSALKIEEKFSSYGKVVSLTSPPTGDPADWPREEIRNWIYNAKPLTTQDRAFIILRG